MAVKYKGDGEYTGLSTDTKPTPANTAAGATFEETDTHETLINTGSAWVRLQRRQSEADYVISVSGSTYYVLDTATGITTSGTNFRSLIDTIADVLCTEPRVGGKILLKRGTYLPDAMMQFPNDTALQWPALTYPAGSPTVNYAVEHCTVEIEGEDENQTIIKSGVNDARHIFNPLCNFVIRNITLDGDFRSRDGIDSRAPIRFEAHNVTIRRCGKGEFGSQLVDDINSWYGFAIWLGNNAAGGDWSLGVKSFVIENCRFLEQNSPAEDVCPTCSEFGIVTKCHFDKTHADSQGFGGSQLTGGRSNRCIYTNNVFYRSQPGDQLGITKELNGDEKEITFTNNLILNSRILLGFSHMRPDTIRVRNITITDNTLRGGSIDIRGPDGSRESPMPNPDTETPITSSSVWRNIIKDVQIKRNHITDSYYKGISLYRCDDVVVEDNYIKNSNAGALATTHADAGLIKIDSAYNVKVKDNDLMMDTTATGYGIRYSNTVFLKMENNTIRNQTGSRPSYWDAGGNTRVTRIEEFGYYPRSSARKYGDFNIFASTPVGTGGGNGIFVQRLVSDLTGSGVVNAPTTLLGKSIRPFATGATINSVNGIRYNLALFKKEIYPKLTLVYNLSSTAAVRFRFIFTNLIAAGASSADPLANQTGIGFWFDSAVSANIRSIRNTGAASSTIADILGGTAAGTTSLHTLSIFGDESSARWILEYDYMPIIYTATIPTTTAMGIQCYIENTAAADKILNIHALEVECT